MKRLFLPLILFLIVILEGVSLELLPTRLVTGELLIIPHWPLVFLVCISIFYDKENTYTSVFYAIIFGMLIDVVYTGILGVYMFTYALVIYIVRGLKKLLHANFYVTLLLGFLGIAMADFIIYIIFSVIDLADMTLVHYLVYRLLPSILANLLFLLVLYPLVRKPLIKWGDEQLHS
ncbi:rod shape-determining protein MreD [Virgibacillus dakarensis]|uniref:Rod shape-determining protein MreD n=1 Tax=Lentibacillus populi TaxID=1827502 RepID=A0A9W5TTR9_9BACI|nr:MULTISPECIES: rod shape-determining protein MreD [Bacillaceae]MBT2215151.1 rod shape-determining protein MreD [Virgibacillus dakarensis]MTW84203.1 rod shape-determining protein MreD [Virgibacillus dakarensis]GGB28222.1 rod shape-determining protein MreD [Lentibacillus populi]